MHLLLLSLGLLLAVGNVISLPVKGGAKGENVKAGQWTQPKDWDWSVTTSSTDKVSTSRLIPVSEATDDLPTPGYKMSDLQQKVLIIPSVIHVNRAVFPKEDSDIHNPETIIPTDNQKKEDTTLTSEHDTTQNNEEKDTNLSSLDESKNISVVKETILLQTTTSTEIDKLNENNATVKSEQSNQEPDLEKDHKDKPEKDKIPVNEPPMVKVTLPEYCSITGLGCRDPPSSVQVNRKENSQSGTESVSQIQTENPNEPHKLNDTIDPLIQTTQVISETTKRSVDNVSKQKDEPTLHQDILDSNQQTEKTSSVSSLPNAPESNTNYDVQSTERVESPSTELVNDSPILQETPNTEDTKLSQDEISQKIESIYQTVLQNEADHQTQLHEASIPQEQIEEAIIKKIESFDNVEQHPVKVSSIAQQDQENVGSSTTEDQKPSNPNDMIPKKTYSSEEIDNSSEEGTNKESFNQDKQKQLQNNEESSEIESHNIDKEMDVNGIPFVKTKETSEEERKLIETQKETNKSKEPAVESPSLGERISGYWKAATGFVSKALNI